MEGGASIDYKKSTTNTSLTDPEPKKDDTLIIKAIKSNYIRLNRELFYVQELLNSNTSWELEHRVTTGANMKIRGIFTEDEVAFSISNTFGEGGMNDTWEGKAMNMARNLHEKASTHAATYNTASKLPTMLGNTLNSGLNAVQSHLTGGNWAGTATEIVSDLAGDAGGLIKTGQEFLNKFGVDKILNSKFIAATDLIKTFQGSSTKFNLPTLKCWIFHNSQGGGEDKADLSKETNNVKSMVKAIVSTCIGEVKDLEGVMGLQYSPGEYRPELQAINMSKYYKDMGFHGTWNLTMGGYTIYNLLIDNIDVSLSKFNAMNRDGGDSGDPLYAELSISLTPASYVSKDDLFHTYDKRGKTSNKINWRTDNNKSNPAPKSESSTYKGKGNGGNSSKSNHKYVDRSSYYPVDTTDIQCTQSIMDNRNKTAKEKEDELYRTYAKIYPESHTGEGTAREVFLRAKVYNTVQRNGGYGECKVDSVRRSSTYGGTHTEDVYGWVDANGNVTDKKPPKR